MWAPKWSCSDVITHPESATRTAKCLTLYHSKCENQHIYQWMCIRPWLNLVSVYISRIMFVENASHSIIRPILFQLCSNVNRRLKASNLPLWLLRQTEIWGKIQWTEEHQQKVKIMIWTSKIWNSTEVHFWNRLKSWSWLDFSASSFHLSLFSFNKKECRFVQTLQCIEITHIIKRAKENM